jgi:hypothetical protein
MVCFNPYEEEIKEQIKKPANMLAFLFCID